MTLTVQQLAELSLFAQTHANNPRLVEWLRAQRESSIKFMTQSMNIDVLRRAQGAIEFQEKMIELLNTARDHLQ